MKKILKLYFAHHSNDRVEMRKIEKNIEKVFRIELLNPFYDQERSDVPELDKMGIKKIDNRSRLDINDCKDLVERDLNAIRKCDGILTILNHASFGTAMEIFTCAYVYRMPVYIVTKKFTYHPWLRYMVNINNGRKFKTISKFMGWLQLNGYKKKLVRE